MAAALAKCFNGRPSSTLQVGSDHLLACAPGRPLDASRSPARAAIPFGRPLVDGQAQAVAAEPPSRVAFATVDIRRALERLQRDQLSVWRSSDWIAAAPASASLLQQPQAQAQLASGSRRPVARRYKMKRDRGGQRACDTAPGRDDLCAVAHQLNPLRTAPIACCARRLAAGLQSAPIGQAQQEQATGECRWSPALDEPRQQRVFHLSKTDCKPVEWRHQKHNGPEHRRDHQRHKQVAGEQAAGRAAKQSSWRCSGSISMNHLNEMRTSAAAAICRAAGRSSSRSGSYGVSCASDHTLATSSSSASSLSPDCLQQQQATLACGPKQSSWWLSRLATRLTSSASSLSENKNKNNNNNNKSNTSKASLCSGSSKRARRNHNKLEPCRGGKFVLRRHSINLDQQPKVQQERQTEAKQVSGEREVSYFNQQVSWSEQNNNQITMASASVSSANRMGASLESAPAGELLRADELHNSSSSTLSAAAAAAAAAGNGVASSHNKNFGKLVGKKAARLKELVLQNLGKADRTQDELFDLYEVNFHKQQQQVSKLTKEFKAYVAALRHFHEASRSLNRCIQQSTSDYQSARHDLVCENLSQLEALNEDLLDKLAEEVLTQVGEYLGKFGEMKEKISKRHRKLIDYDKSRRLYELMLAQVNKRRAKQNQALSEAANSSLPGEQESENYQSILRGLKFLSQQQESASGVNSQQEFIASQLVDEARLLKFREQFNYSKLMYENINGELHDELPIVWEKKMKSLLSALQSYFALETQYHSGAAKLVGTVSEVIDEMPHCVDLQQAVEAARKLSLGGQLTDCNNNININSNSSHPQDEGLHHCERNAADEEDEHDDDDDVDDDSYESGSSSDSRAGPAGDVCAEKARQLKVSAGGSSSGLGSSRGDSSCSVGSSSPECARAKHDISMEPAAIEERAGGPRGESRNPELESGKAEQPADCSAGVAASAAAGEPAAPPEMTHQPEVESEPALEVASACAESEEKEAPTSAPLGESSELNFEVVGEETSSKPSGLLDAGANILYKVRTNYKYLAEDVDELCFEADEIIHVIEFEQHQEPEEGWLMGLREINGQRGLFPANFTQPI